MERERRRLVARERPFWRRLRHHRLCAAAGDLLRHGRGAGGAGVRLRPAYEPLVSTRALVRGAHRGRRRRGDAERGDGAVRGGRRRGARHMGSRRGPGFDGGGRPRVRRRARAPRIRVPAAERPLRAKPREVRWHRGGRGRGGGPHEHDPRAPARVRRSGDERGGGQSACRVARTLPALRRRHRPAARARAGRCRDGGDAALRGPGAALPLDERAGPPQPRRRRRHARRGDSDGLHRRPHASPDAAGGGPRLRGPAPRTSHRAGRLHAADDGGARGERADPRRL